MIFIPGIEVESAEEVHIICLFPDTETACRFGEVVRKNLPDIRNDAELFGYQYIMDENDDITGHDRTDAAVRIIDDTGRGFQFS